VSKDYQTSRGRAGIGRVTAKKTKPAKEVVASSADVDDGLPV
jgi:hypothetical protein